MFLLDSGAARPASRGAPAGSRRWSAGLLADGCQPRRAWRRPSFPSRPAGI